MKLTGPIEDAETIATGRGIRELKRVQRAYGKGNWRKRKGRGTVELPDGTKVRAEIHWYEAHGKGKFEFKIKRVLSSG